MSTSPVTEPEIEEADHAVFPVVSIITVVYNDRQPLRATIASVLEQQYPYIEYIVVDGGSTDGTLDVIREHEEHIDRWVSEPDKGLYDAMNKGLDMATGDFVWFLNAGDLAYAPDTLEELFAGYEGEDAIYGQAALMNAEGEIVGMRSHKQLPRQLTWRHMRLGMVVCHQALLIRRTIAPHYNLRYRIAADIDWTIRALRKAKGVKNSGRVLCKFLLGGTSSKQWRKSLVERFSILRHHFGLPMTVLSHLQIVAENVIRRRPFQRLLVQKREN